MPETEFRELSELDRADPAERNGHEEPGVKKLPGFADAVRAPQGNTPGRTVDPRGRSFGPVADTERRPYGREAAFLESLEAIADFDPQTSQAVNNFLRLINPGHEVVVYTGPLGKGETRENGKGQALADLWVPDIASEYGGGLDQLHNVLSLGLVTHGAIAAEVAPLQDLSGIEDWYPLTPLAFEFKRMPVFEDDKVGKLTLGHKGPTGKWQPANPNQVFYQPLDPAVNKPYGRPPLMAALSVVLSKSQMLNDLRAVAHNQGYPRIDVTVLWEVLAKAAPPGLRDGGRDKQLTEWMRAQLELVANDYVKLGVDDTFVHYDWIKVGLVGPNYAATSFDFKGLEAILSRQINSALKTLPILLGYNETTSETHGSIQWQIQVDTIIALQKVVKRLIERLFNASLRLHGVDARAKVQYKKIRTVDRKHEAESEFVEAKTRQIWQLQGWRDGDDISQELFGENAKGEPIIPGATGKDPGGVSSEEDEEADSKRGVFDALFAAELRTPVTLRRAVEDEINDQCDLFAVAAGVVFMQAKADLIEQLRLEGLLSEDPEKRDQAKDVADYVFGLRFSREMKRLLREAIRRGMELADPDTELDVPERLVDRVWRSNQPYVRRIRDDLKAALRAGAFSSVSDIEQWFADNAFRETLMGRFLARQGLAGGYAYQVSRRDVAIRFTWQLNPAEHCKDCPEREGETYTYDELLSIGLPGSINLDCAGNCKCSVVEVA